MAARRSIAASLAKHGSLAILLFFGQQCVTRAGWDIVIGSAALASGPEFYSPRIKRGAPAGGDTFEAILAEPRLQQIESLRETVALLDTYPILRARIVGHTDNLECRQLACETLSLRRATLLRDWLVREGVRESQLEPAVGAGSRMPLAYNSTEEGRATNRRVEILFP